MMKLRIKIVGTVCIMALLTAFILPSAGAAGLPWKAKSALKDLQGAAGSTLTIEWSSDTGRPSYIGGKLTRPSKHTPEWIVFGFLNKYRALYGIRDVRSQLRLEGVERQANGAKVYLRQVMFGIPVWEDQLTVALDAKGVVREVAGSIYPDLETKLGRFAMHSAYSEQAAIRVALNQASGEPANEPVAERYYLAARKGTPLVYIVDLSLRDPDRIETFVIHSMTGRIIEQRTTAR